MYTVDRYEEYLNAIPSFIQQAKENQTVPVFAFASDLDVVLRWDVEKYNAILDKYLTEPPRAEEGEPMRDLASFARISSHYMTQGLGGAFDITDAAVCECLREAFSSETAMGGACGQAAAAIATMGFPVNAHLTDECREVCELLDFDGATVVHGGKKAPVMEAVSGKPPIYHFVIQFREGDILRIQGREVRIPAANRLIMLYDNVHKYLPVQEDFLRYWETADEKPSSVMLSGFDAITDEALMAQRMDRMEAFIRRVRDRSPETVIYLEGAFYLNSALKEYVFTRLGVLSDIISMNEEELAAQAKRFGVTPELDNAAGIVRALDAIRGAFRPGGVILHTKDYSLFYGRPIPGVDIEAGLTIGNLMSGTRARIGRYGTAEDCRETARTVPLSRQGLRVAEEAGCRALAEGERLIVVPSRLLERPKYTIGLGDTFIAGVHTCFVKRDAR